MDAVLIHCELSVGTVAACSYGYCITHSLNFVTGLRTTLARKAAMRTASVKTTIMTLTMCQIGNVSAAHFCCVAGVIGSLTWLYRGNCSIVDWTC